MKPKCLFLLIIFMLAACECYDCEREVARTTDKPYPGYPVAATIKFTATKEEAEALNGLLIIEKDTINGVIITSNIKTRCETE
jgi:hypothetical protein